MGDLRAFFPGTDFHPSYWKALHNSLRSWPDIETETETLCRAWLVERAVAPWCVVSGSHLASVVVATTVDCVEMYVGGERMVKLPGVIVRAMAGERAEVDVLPYTLGTRYPVGAVCYQDTRLRHLGPGDVKVTVVGPTPRPSEPYLEVTKRVVIVNVVDVPKPLGATTWYQILIRGVAMRVYALYVLVEHITTGVVVDDVIDTITLRVCDVDTHDTREHTFNALALRSREHPPIGGIVRGYTLPVVEAFNFAKVNMYARLSVLPNVDASLHRVTFAHAKENFLNVKGGMCTLQYYL